MRLLAGVVLAVSSVVVVDAQVGAQSPDPGSASGPGDADAAEVAEVSDDDGNVAVEWRSLDGAAPDGASDDELIQVSQDFTDPALMTGLTWGGGQPEAVWLQQRSGGVWGAWEPLLAEHGHDHGVGVDGEGGLSDEGVDERPGTDAVVVAEPEAFRFAVQGPIEDAQVFIYVDPPSADVQQSLPNEALDSIPSGDFEPLWPGPSFVRGREAWDTTNCRVPGAVFDFSSSRAVIVHHTAGSSNYSQSQVPAVLRGLCAFQTGSRNLDDVGYNFVVDRFGTVWEGRTGSKTAPIQSAHARSFNYNTQGVVMLGNYDQGPTPTAQVAGLHSIVDWLTGWYGIDPDGPVALVAGSDGPGHNEGDVRVVNGVAGHRDVGQTSCPGNFFYPSLNGFAARTRPTDFGTDADHPLDAWIESTGFARFIDPNSRGAGQVITDYRSFRDRWTSITDVDLDGDGRDELLYYDWAVGFARFVEPSRAGGGSVIRDYDFRAGWTSITDVDLNGDGQDELLYYQSSTGLARFVDPGSQGGGRLIRDYSFRPGWTSITEVDLNADGEDEILYYNSATGFARFVDPGSKGGGRVIRDYSFRPGWTSITNVDLNADGEDEILYYG